MPDTDPLSILAADITPTAPNPSFAAALRAELVRALGLPRGVVRMTSTMNAPTRPRVPYPGALPYLAAADARAAIEFYRSVFDAEVGEPIIMPDGRIGHCELTMGGGTVYLADAHPEIGVVAPMPVVPRDAGDRRGRYGRHAGAVRPRRHCAARAVRGLWVRNAVIVDPAGHRWMLNGPVRAAVADPIRHGDLAYFSLHPVDIDAATRFYAAVLGWEYDTDTGPRREVTSVAGALAIFAGDGSSFAAYAVDDLTAAADAVRHAGGTAADVQDRPWGQVVDCVDTLGTAFALFQARPDVPRPATGISYLTYETTDSAAFRDFYGTVLGWQFVAGSVPDGWHVAGDITPMSGAGGGADRTAMVPMWQVGDVVAAAEQVVAAGGRVLDEPVQRPYGMTAKCVDDQGGRFYLGE
jgi:predicted enzyme related to lactoylglutathione lyase